MGLEPFPETLAETRLSRGVEVSVEHLVKRFGTSGVSGQALTAHGDAPGASSSARLISRTWRH